MNQTHFLQNRFEKPFHDSKAFWSIKPSGKLILFIHGFGGDSISSWIDFPAIQVDEPTVDLVFWGYDSFRRQANVSAADLVKFLNMLFVDGERVSNTTIPLPLKRDRKFQITEIWLVAHSLGAVVARLALIKAIKEKYPWVLKTHLFLFAPAHEGSRDFIKVATDELSGLAWGLALIGKYKIVTAEELLPGSPTLRNLKSQTQKLLNMGNSSLVAKTVVFGTAEKIVNVNDYCDDPPHRNIEGADHFSVCKPTSSHRSPIEMLLAELRLHA